MMGKIFIKLNAVLITLTLCLAGCIGTSTGELDDNLINTLRKHRIISVDSGLITIAALDPITDNGTGKTFIPMGVVNSEGKIVIPLEYEGINARDAWRTGAVIVSKKEKKGLADLNGNILVPCQYDMISDFYGNYAIIKKGGKVGIIDNQGNVALPVTYDQITQFYSKYFSIGYNEKYHYESVFYAFSGGHRQVFNFSRKDGNVQSHIDAPDDYQPITSNGKYGFVNYLGEEIPCQYENVRDSFSQGLAAVVKNHKIGFIDKTGAVKIPFEYEYSEFCFNFYQYGFAKFSEGLCGMRKGGKFGYIDKNGNTAIPYEYDDGSFFRNGLAIVEKGNGDHAKCGVIDKNNRLIIPFEYESILFMDNESTLGEPVFSVMKNKKWGLCSLQGKILADCEYEQSILDFYKGYADVTINGKKGVIDSQGQLVIKPEYESLFFDGKWAFVQKGDQYGIIDINNREVIPFQGEKNLSISQQRIGNIDVLVKRVNNQIEICDLDGHNLLE